ncbi:DsrE family protein [Algoriphagus zhangzhouensis]|uniref:Intracellular sulfur oxidation protein, DsrE/DsrF family n=1 Tax=Algoriphagus zhangzhouensis TaxID=1073327 RepID=A0A1M7ZEL3_9BACT|nr:DsrE family protein [Algoriphagus zhangzhouensis]TDY46097.1 intracellular sulfur oxidation DsrE/DsrF family protein [Algoriphagus zhangzhouensis]SHO63361.1 Intracellular sulfur oxidation protein, DsrE/DsrF family [Algoriphagus zhangzhouensis]
MKKYTFLLLAFCFVSVSTAFSQTVIKEQTISDLNKNPNYAFGVRDADGFNSALGMFDALSENGVSIENFEIVVKGPIVKELVKGSEMEKQFQKYKSKVKVSICSIAMKRLNVSEEELFDGLDIAESYSIRLLQLQALGYSYLIY